MVCCYTAVLHLRPTEVIDWFGHVECSHLVCSNVFFLLGFFFFLPSSSLPFPLHPHAASAGWGVGAGGRKRQRSASPREQSGAAASAALSPAQTSDSLGGIRSSFSKNKLGEGRDTTTEPQNLRVTADFLLILQKRSAIVIRLPK